MVVCAELVWRLPQLAPLSGAPSSAAVLGVSLICSWLLAFLTRVSFLFNPLRFTDMKDALELPALVYVSH